MKLQRFVGKNSKTVMEEIRAVLGDEALIVSNSEVGTKTEIIAASDTTVELNDDAPISLDTREERTQIGFGNESTETLIYDERSNDPWAQIKNINNEILAIKSSLKQIPKNMPSGDTALKDFSLSPKDADVRHDQTDPLEVIDSLRSGCHVVWGARLSGKTILIREIIRRRASEHLDTWILRLPHKDSNHDAHLAAVAAKGSANLIFVNHLEGLEETLEEFISDRLVLIEADLSLLPKLADTNHISWLAGTKHYLIDEDQKQTELVSQLLLKFKADTPETVSSSIISDFDL